jgi:amino acid transporter
MFLLRLRETLYFFWHHLTDLLWRLLPVVLPFLLFINYRLFFVLDGDPEKALRDLSFLLAQMLSGVAAAALTIRYALAVLGKTELTPRRLWQDAVLRMPALFLVQILAGLAIVLGLLAFIVPGLYLMGALLPAYVLVVHEGQAPLQALKSSWTRFRGQAWEVSAALGLLLLVLLLVLSGLESLGHLLQQRSPGLQVLANTGLNMVGLLFTQMLPVLLVRFYELEVSSAGKS